MSGGVACNSQLREGLCQAASSLGFEVVFPPPSLCSDNGAMIAWTGVEYFRENRGVCDDPEALRYHPQWPLGTAREV